MLMKSVFVAKNVNKLSTAKFVEMTRNVTEHTHGKISKSCIPCRFRHSKAGENATWGRTPTCNADSISTTTLDFPDLTQFWNFTDQFALKEERKICGGLMYHFKEQALPQEEWVESTASEIQWWSVIYSTYVTKHVLDEVVHALLPRLFPTIH
eukprot:g24222.t1